MRVEEALIKLGNRPLRNSPFSVSLLGIINGHFKREGVESITNEILGDELLTRIYELETSDAVLDRKVGGIRDHDRYRTVMTIVAVLMVMVVAIVAIMEIVNAGTEKSGIGLDALIELIRIIIKMLGG